MATRGVRRSAAAADAPCLRCASELHCFGYPILKSAHTLLCRPHQLPPACASGGNSNAQHKTERTAATAGSSRGDTALEVSARLLQEAPPALVRHATPSAPWLQVHVRRTRRNHYKAKQLFGKLALVDLAGSERAAETNNMGQKLRDGASINRSLLALANCINALGKSAGGRAYVPYRNSKLTRLLKDGLSGNSRTAMVATVAAASDQYHHTINTLKYANRAKEIKTHVVQNVASVESHISDYRSIIDNLQVSLSFLFVFAASLESRISDYRRIMSHLRARSCLVCNTACRCNEATSLRSFATGHMRIHVTRSPNGCRWK